MRTAEEYKKLVKGYSFSLSILKTMKPKLYDKIIKTKKLFDERGDNFYDFIRNLRVDYINEHDEKDSGIPLIASYDFIAFKEDVSLNYMPNEGYTLGVMYEKSSVLGSSKIFLEIFPTTLEDVKQNNIVHVLRISTLKELEKEEKFEAKKIVNYIAGIAEDSFLVLVQDLDHPKNIKPGLEVTLSEFDDLYEDLTSMF